MAASKGLMRSKYLIEMDDKELFEAESLENALSLLLGCILLMSAEGWIKVEPIKDDPPTYKILLSREEPILRRFEEHIVIMKEVKRGL
ncbi:MAG: hypothetical protein B6U65_03680 [Candidatus Wolframiiraptor sp. EX4484-121]|nr:MAG: hypothetical protein B6U65_03680 [Candidatus Wolframiiraptor sp. EX4484-121]